jgi:outer membrane protein assembly factor BamB
MTCLNSGRMAIMVALSLTVAGCTTVGGYYDKWFGSAPALKPAELVAFKPVVPAKILWQGNAGGADKFVFTPAVSGGTVYAAGASGQIVRFDLRSGKPLSRIETKTPLSGGVASDGSIILAGTARGEVLAFDSSAKALWKAQLTSEVLSAPVVAQGMVVVRTGDGRIVGLDATNGNRRWAYQRPLPPLTVRGHTGTALSRDSLFAGFPGGRLVALNLISGNVAWEATVALPKGSTELERVADISGLPVVDARQVCAAAFQGRVACFDLAKGATLWARDISSISGLAMDGRNVYVADDKSAVVAFDKNSGASMWKQDKLYGRSISGPAVAGLYVVVGDYQGYVHFLSNDDGSFVARVATDGSGIIAQPMVVEGNILVQTRAGGVFAIGIP